MKMGQDHPFRIQIQDYFLPSTLVLFLPSVSSCFAMKNLLKEQNNVFWHQYEVITAAGPGAGIGIKALPPVREKLEMVLKQKQLLYLVQS